MQTSIANPSSHNSRSSETPSPILIWIVDDRKKQRQLITDFLEETEDIRCIGAFNNCEAMFKYVTINKKPVLPHVVIMDFQLATKDEPNCMNGVVGAQKLKEKYDDISIVMLTINDSTRVIFDSICAGASGFVNKADYEEILPDAIKHALSGGMWMPPMVAQRVSDHLEKLRGDVEEDFHLTKREIEILQWMGKGLKRREIAERMHLSSHTIDSHLRNIYKKTHSHTPVAAYNKAFRKGYL